MNKKDMDVLLALARHPGCPQRELAAVSGYSLGGVNASVQALVQEGCITARMQLTEYAEQLLQQAAPQRAILLAAGLGLQQSLRQPPIPKALLQVRGQRLIERLIFQLHQTGITEIYVIVGFAKEQFEYLIDRYGVELIVNTAYAGKNNLHSLALAGSHLRNCYIVPCDLWCRENPFRKQELYSWYMVSDAGSTDSSLRVNRKQELVTVPASTAGNAMIGISYLTETAGEEIAARLTAMDGDRRYNGAFWEETLYNGDRFLIAPRLVAAQDVKEINSANDLRELNDGSAAVATQQITKILNLQARQIQSLTPVKKGTTNTSYLVRCDTGVYCIRIPTGEKDGLIDRQREAQIYTLLEGQAISEKVVHFDPGTGCKLSEYMENMRHCDPLNAEDVTACMQHLRQFHRKNLQTPYEFDLFGAIAFYESLWEDSDSLYPDYAVTRQQIFSLQAWLEHQPKALCLTHLDAVPENFLIPTDGSGALRLIDWEYAAMQDPHMDIAMFCLQALYDQSQTDAAIDAYFPEGCSRDVRLKIYCYMAACGLLWSNWCEYQIRKGAEFGAYSLQQYRAAKLYYRLVQNECHLL